MKITSCEGQVKFGIHKTQVKIMVPGPTYTLQEKHKNQKDKNKNFIPDENKKYMPTVHILHIWYKHSYIHILHIHYI